MSPVRPMASTWTPGPTGAPVAPTVAELCAGLYSRRGAPGFMLESGRSLEFGWTQVLVVLRDDRGEPIGVLQIKLLEGLPELVDIAVLPEHRGRGFAFELCKFAKEHGFDLREMGAIWNGPLTDDGRAFRDEAVLRGNAIYGELT